MLKSFGQGSKIDTRNSKWEVLYSAEVTWAEISMSTKVHLHVLYPIFTSFSIATATWNSHEKEKCLKLLLWELLVFPEFLCKILVLTKQLMQDDLCLWVLPIGFNNTGHENYHYAIRKYQKVEKSQIQVSERSRAQFVLWAAWELSAYIPRCSPSCWNKQEFLAQQVMPGQASQRRGLSEHWEPCEGSTNVIWRRYKHCVCNVLEQPWRHLPRAC